MAQNVLLIVNDTKPQAQDALPEIEALIKEHGTIAAVICDNGTDRIENAHNADIIVVLGGDGTLLTNARRCLNLNLPILGVNFGKLGFMAEFDQGSLHQHAEELFAKGPTLIHERHLLTINVYKGDSPTPAETGIVLNECVITAGPPYRMIAMDVAIDDQPGPMVTGDGLIVSTPTGSTAYNVSAGGPIVAPGVNAMIITPIAAHSLSFRPIVIPGSSTVSVHMNRVNANGPGGGTTLVLDGQTRTPLAQGDRIVITMHDQRVRFVANPKGSYWNTLIQKMSWATPPTAHIKDRS